MTTDELRRHILAILQTGIAEKEMMHTEDMPETTANIIALTQRIALEARIDELKKIIDERYREIESGELPRNQGRGVRLKYVKNRIKELQNE